MLVLVLLLTQLSASPAPPTPVMGQRSLADVARERSQRTGGVKPTPIVLDLPTPVPPRSMGELTPTIDWRQRAINAQRETAAAEPTPTTIAVERGAADAVADFGSKAGAAVGLAGLGFGAFALFFVALVWLCSPLIGIRIGRDKGLPDWAGLLAGLLLGPFVLLMALVAPSHKKCPFCQSNIPIAATVCPRCQREQPKRSPRA